MPRTKGKPRSDAAAEGQPLARGSLVQLRRRCGKINCHCREGQPHWTWALSYSVQGKTKLLTLRDRDLARVRRALGRYRRAAAELERKALGGIARLAQQIREDKRKELG